MKIVRIVVLIASLVPLFSNAQISIDAYRNYGYCTDNQFDEVYFNSLSFNFGMARRFMLLHPIESSGSSESHSVGLSALDKSSQAVHLGGQSYGNKAKIGYNTWDGTKLGGSGHIRINDHNTININASVYADERINTIEEVQLKNKVEGAIAQASYHFYKNKTDFASYVMLKTDDRKYVLNDSLGNLNTNQQLVIWNNTFSYKPSINSKLKAYTGLSVYKGDFDGSFVVYKGNQNLLSGGIELEVVRPTWFMLNSANFQALNDVQALQTNQNRIELSNIFQPKLAKFNTKLKIRNSIVLTSDNQFYYAPSVALHHNWAKVKLYANAARSVHTQTNTLERTPYFEASYTGLKNLAIDRFDVHPSFELSKKIIIRGLLAHSRFENLRVANNELKTLSRANITIEKKVNNYTTISGSYNYRFWSNGNLANLAPKHIAFLELRNMQIESAYLGNLLHQKLYWGFDLVGGYRSNYSSIANNTLVNDAVQGQYFIDFSYRISSLERYYNNTFPLVFTFSVRNLLAKNALVTEQQANAALLFSEGIRTARSFTLGIEYVFRNNRY